MADMLKKNETKLKTANKANSKAGLPFSTPSLRIGNENTTVKEQSQRIAITFDIDSGCTISGLYKEIIVGNTPKNIIKTIEPLIRKISPVAEELYVIINPTPIIRSATANPRRLN